MNYFFILFQGRCGSTMLINMLQQHDQVNALMEQLFKYDNSRAELNFIDTFFTQAADKPGCKAIGFKEQLDNIIDPAAVVSHLIDCYDARFILMRRNNLVNQTFSRIGAARLVQKSGTHNLWDEAHRITPFEVSLERFRRMLIVNEKKAQRLLEFSKSLPANTLEISYEDLISDLDSNYARVCEYIGIDIFPTPKPQVFKNLSTDLSESITNYAQISEAFRDTAYADQFL